MAEPTTPAPAPIAVTLYLDPETKAKIESLRLTVGVTLNGFIRAAIAEHLKRHPAVDAETLSRIVSHS